MDTLCDTRDLKSGLARIGLNLTSDQLEELVRGNLVSLEHLGLSELGSIFILASAVSALNLGRKKRKITFGDLPNPLQNCTCCSGIPVYCWLSDEKCCIYLTLLEGKPVLRRCSQIQVEQVSDSLVQPCY